MVIIGDRCPSCGAKLGQVVNVRYQGNTTKVRYLAAGELDEHGDEVELDHVCGDR